MVICMELFRSKSFNAMESSLYALQLQTQVSAQNLANLETPGYKSKTVSFSDVFENTQSNYYKFRAHIYEDETGAIRPDGNNVDSDVESMKVAKAYIQSVYLMQKISGQFTNVRYILENAPK